MTRVAFGYCGHWERLIVASLDDRYVPSFVDPVMADLRGYDAVVPTQMEQYSALARYPELYGRRFFHPAPRVTALCHDKFALAEFLVAEGFSDVVPPVRAPGPPYPYVWKKRRGCWGRHCRVVGGPSDERYVDPSDCSSFAQTVALGEIEYATHVLRVGGEVLYASTFAHTMAGPSVVFDEVQRPVSTRFRPGCAYLEVFSEILARLGFEGTACFDYKVVDGRPRVFEINPRYGGSLCGDVTAYLDAYVGALA